MSTLPKILIVDDKQANLLALQRILKGVAATVMTARSGEESLSLCMRHSFALALIDVYMPDMDGMQLVEYLRSVQQTREIPIIFITAALQEDIHKLRGYELGALDYIQKPIDDRILLSKVGVFLELYNTHKELRLHRDHLAELVQERTASLGKTQETLRALNRHMNKVREEEQRRIARAIHDEMGNVLANQKMTIQWLQRNHFNHERMVRELDLMQHQLDDIIAKVRDITMMLYPPILDQCELLAAMEWQASEFTRISGIACLLNPDSVDIALDDNRKIALFRILQESLTNILKHAKATEVRIGLLQMGDRLRLSIHDNGQGIHEQILFDSMNTMGLCGMEERACQNGGELHVETSSTGTNIIVIIPIHLKRP
ncbi:MAG: response regulator [Magnetococcus sp. YQC-5]